MQIYHHDIGYFLVFDRLLIKSAIISMIIAPSPTGMIVYKYPIAWIFELPITAIKAVAPPGGWRVFVACMAAIAVATASAAANHGVSGKNRYAVTPMMAEIIWPPTKFLGCANGLLTAP